MFGHSGEKHPGYALWTYPDKPITLSRSTSYQLWLAGQKINAYKVKFVAVKAKKWLVPCKFFDVFSNTLNLNHSLSGFSGKAELFFKSSNSLSITDFKPEGLSGRATKTTTRLRPSLRTRPSRSCRKAPESAGDLAYQSALSRHV
jgi:hypothetical protein